MVIRAADAVTVRFLVVMAAVVLILHGLIHLMGTAAYLKLTGVAGLPYKTTLLNGRWDVGDTGRTLLAEFLSRRKEDSAPAPMASPGLRLLLARPDIESLHSHKGVQAGISDGLPISWERMSDDARERG